MTSLPILFQDEWLVAIDKPPGVLVHPSDQPKPGVLVAMKILRDQVGDCLLYTSPSPRDATLSRMPSSA